MAAYLRHDFCNYCCDVLCRDITCESVLGRALSHHKQEASCIYVNNAGPWNAIMHLDFHGTEGPAYACTSPYNNAQSCTYLFRLKRGVTYVRNNRRNLVMYRLPHEKKRTGLPHI